MTCYRFIEVKLWISSQRLISRPYSRYSSLRDNLDNTKNEVAEGAASHHREEELKAHRVTDVFYVGTGIDGCVAHTAFHAVQADFKPCVLSDVVWELVRVGRSLSISLRK